ncbi:hypothetical protein NA56DRAFT_593677 [Hyaloscypha hepaticicola]|uniref:Nucleoside-diphosphate-sugar epimerase n=1 Tax=Hyaloscypha hepaticicola TaxID=2082293 RepID=A0A2J6QH14_9HELO|nr:hypothetical protein NA56DRAFT_593677 [Hyaloscypha hepaticicola]
MHLVLTGATGLVGSAVLHQMLVSPTVSKISILSRRPVTQAEGQPKAHVIIHKNYAEYPSQLLEQLKDVDGVVWAQGISSTQVSKPEYETITNTYPLAFAKALAKTTAPKPLNFIYVSGEGATTTPSFLTQHWARIKGMTEASLLSLSKESEYSNLRPISLRPAGVDPMYHEEVKAYIPQRTGLMGAFEKAALPVLRPLLPSMISPTRELGKVLVELACGDGAAHKEGESGVSGEGRTLNNVAMRRIAGI